MSRLVSSQASPTPPRANTVAGPTLERRHIIACQQAAQRQGELHDIECDLSDETLAAWRAMYTKYERDPTAPNPFMPHVSCKCFSPVLVCTRTYPLRLAAPPSEQLVKAQLVEEEAETARNGKVPMRATSKTTFIVAALQLEDQQ